MIRRAGRHVVLSISILAAALGCAKRPALTTASAPAPTGAATTTVTRSETTVATVQPPAPAPPPAVATPAPAPAPAPRPAPRQFEATPELRMIHFDFDKSDIRPGDAKILDANARWLTANPRQLVLVEGHCDERGTNEYNLALGERRARATMNYLVGRGVQAGRITTISYGEERPLCTQHTEACWARNRRAQFLVKLAE